MKNKEGFIRSYVTPREDILKLIPQRVEKVLDVGCSTGALGEALKRRQQAEVVGIELDKDMANVAEKKLDKVIVGNMNLLQIQDKYPQNYFDCLVFGDILEHLQDPWKVLKNLSGLLKKDGVVIISLPNVQHHSTFTNVFIKGYWPRNERGIHDATHLRWFTLKNIRELLRQAGLKERKVVRKYRIIERPHLLNKISFLFAIPFFRGILTHQYLVVAKKV